MGDLERALNLIDANSLIEYFYQLKWKIDLESSQKKAELTSPEDEDGNTLKVYIARKKDFYDYESSIMDALNVLSTLEKKPVLQIASEVIRSSVDILRASAAAKSLSVAEAYKSVKALRNMMLYAACAIEEPEKSYDMPTTNASNLLEQFNFGHTFEGGFGFTVSSTVQFASGQLSLFDKEKIPDERMVIERMAAGLNDICLAAKKEDVSLIIKNYKRGLNAKICEALLDFAGDGRLDTHYSISWSNNIAPSAEFAEGGTWHLSKCHYKILEEAYYKLKEVEPQVACVSGKIVTLHSRHIPDGIGDFEGRVILKTEYEGRRMDIKLYLNRQDYNEALKAHQNGEEVTVRGMLRKEKSIWNLRVVSLEIRKLKQA